MVRVELPRPVRLQTFAGDWLPGHGFCTIGKGNLQLKYFHSCVFYRVRISPLINTNIVIGVRSVGVEMAQMVKAQV